MFKKIVFGLAFVTYLLPHNAMADSTVKCDAGYYLPANSSSKDDCRSCPNGLGVYCEGGKFQKNVAKNQGINFCAKYLVNQKGSLTQVSKDKAKCETPSSSDKIKCSPGQFLPAGKSVCEYCADYITNSAGVAQQSKVEKAIQDFQKAANKKIFTTVSSDPSMLTLYPAVLMLSLSTVYCPGGDFVRITNFPSGLYYCKDGPSASFDRCGVQAGSATSGSIHCDAGFWSPKDSDKCNKKCNDGYDRTQGAYCPGGDFKKYTDAPSGVKTCAKGTEIVNSDMTGCIKCQSGKSKNYTECERLETTDDKIKKLADRTLSCNAGFYMMTKQEYIGRLQDNSSQSSLGNQTTSLEQVPYCMSCFDWGNNHSYGYRCPGVKNKKLTDKEQGKEYCPSGQVTLREDPTTCVDKPVTSVTCKSGEYLPAKEQKCKSCKGLGDHIYCPGDTYKPSTKDDQGYYSCKDTYVADSGHTKCVCPSGKVEENNKCVVPIACVAGNVWSKGKCAACDSNTEWSEYLNENRMYCPEVRDTSLSVYKQFKKCPKGAWPNHDFSDCDCRWGTKSGDRCKNITISATDLQYGPNGKGAPLFKQCWTKSTEATYKKCMGFDD